MFEKDFWNARAIKHGHTGYADPFLYSFDQEARLFAVKKILSRLIPEPKRDKALDFGCGTGDFIPVLQEKFSLVVGYDFSKTVLEIAERSLGRDVKLVDDKKALWDNGLYDLILSVTVLQDFNYQELNQALRELSLLLVNSGYLIAVEFFVNDEWNVIHSEQRTTLGEWSQALEANGLSIVSRHAFYNPVAAPTPSWKEYASDPWLKFLRVFRKFDFAKKTFMERSKKIIQKHQDVLGVEDNSYYIYVIQKTTHAD